MATYVLVHGAYQGGWIWKPVAQRLRAAGHEVYAPTLEGCGERHDHVRPGITVGTHAHEVARLLFYEDLRDVVLGGLEGDAETVRDLFVSVAFAELGEDFLLREDSLREQVGEKEKVFRVGLRVRSEEVRALPSLEIPYFNTRSGTYQTARSAAVPITVRPTRVLTRDDVIGVEDLPLTLETPAPGAGEGAGLIAAVEGLERRMIRDALAKADGTQTRAAELLGISERVLRYKLKKYGLKAG